MFIFSLLLASECSLSIYTVQHQTDLPVVRTLFFFILAPSPLPFLPLFSSLNMTTVGWVSDPNGRGTSGLVVSCVLTLGLCVWSALHLNIPPKDEHKRSYWMRNIRWILLGVFIPELVILSAWRQWASARELHQEMKQIIDGEEDGLCGGDTEKAFSTHNSSTKVCDFITRSPHCNANGG
jgi:hypothetical protein